MISANLRRTVRTLYAFSCGYCGITETEVGAYLTIDHFMPVTVGGTDDVDNLVYACHACNLHKAATYDVQNPSVLHPFRNDMSLHTRLQADGVIEALTLEGERHIDTLHLNHPLMVKRRRIGHLVEALLKREAQALARDARVDKEVKVKKWRVVRKGKRPPNLTP